MILIITLGFDEKFALRAIFRHGLKANDKILILMPEKSDPRAEKAFSIIQQIVGNSFPEVSIEKIYIPSQDFPKAVSVLRKLALNVLREGEKVILNISGGQRIVILELLTGFLSVDARNVEVEIESEDSSTMAIFPLEMMRKMDLDQEDIKILEILAQSPKNFNQICLILNLSKSSVWRRLRKLMELGLIEKKEKTYQLTELGYSRISQNQL
ncbi:MAG: CRISPR-associated CARF protein Csa3 [Candidatus Nezhaarchaeales archaeon]|nr:CRISPR-associated CARF protein Csa3 [Candidatus Geocrenenecus dongiae]